MEFLLTIAKAELNQPISSPIKEDAQLQCRTLVHNSFRFLQIGGTSLVTALV
jgi:hypothetical protein